MFSLKFVNIILMYTFWSWLDDWSQW